MKFIDPYLPYLVGIGAVGLIIEIYVLVKSLRRHKQRRTNITQAEMDGINIEQKYNALIEDEELGTVKAYINFDDFNPPTLMIGDKREPVREWNYYNDMVYYLKCPKKYHLEKVKPEGLSGFLDTYLTPIEPPLELGEMPDSLWRALHRAYDFIPIEFEIPPPEWLMGMMKYAVIALAIGGLIFIVAKGKT